MIQQVAQPRPRAPVRAAGRLIDRYSVIVVGIAALLWASDVVFRVGLIRDGLTSSQLVLGEDALITLCFVPLARRVIRESRALSRRGWVALVLIAIGPQALATVMFTRSLSISFAAHTAGSTYLLQQAQPLIAVVLAWRVLGETRRPWFWPLAALSVAAVYLVAFAADPLRPFSDLSHGAPVAALLAIGAATLWASGTVLGRYALREVSFVATTALRFTLALPVLLIVVLVETGPGAIGAYRWSELPDFLGIALLPGLAALTLYYRALSSTPASLATFAEMTYPVAATLLVALPPPYGFAQPLLPAQLLGSALLIGAMLALNAGKRRRLVTLPGVAAVAQPSAERSG